MPLFSTQVTIETADNIAANFATNTWHVLAPDLVELALWHTALASFYQTIDTDFSNLVKTTDGLKMKSYNIEDPIPRAPVLTATATLAVGSNPIPTECSIVMSFQAAQSSGIPQARRRNRVFLPFFDTTALAATGRPASATQSNIITAATALLAASGPSSGDWQWMVYSPTDGQFDLVDNGWVDDEFDTQRRRGRPATSRVLF